MLNSLNFTLGVDALYWTLTIIFSAVVTLILLLRSGHGYSVEDTQAHAVDFGGEISEGHGGMTAFLWVYFILFIIWMIVYFIQHAGEFGIIFVSGG
jgi:hypothetical protein